MEYFDSLNSPLFSSDKKQNKAQQQNKESNLSSEPIPYVMSGKFYMAVFRSNDGRPCISNTLYRSEEEARKELGQDYLGLYSHVEPFEYFFKG